MERTGVREQGHRAVFRTSVQVAAVCYRRQSHGVEFLLVRTSSGKWIFPKGRVHELLSDSEAALREAWEEAGVIGSIDPECFHSFWYFKGSRGSDLEEPAVLMKAYLVEVLHQHPPQEEDRMPTWFAAAEARRRLGQDRDLRARGPLLGVIAQALARLPQA
ncbi:MAG TPA: NUDIX domain-containing protein [Terriglobales bacterium]|nr:NUDIX domain-containing protein [Terriglobales bacterium]